MHVQEFLGRRSFRVSMYVIASLIGLYIAVQFLRGLDHAKAPIRFSLQPLALSAVHLDIFQHYGRHFYIYIDSNHPERNCYNNDQVNDRIANRRSCSVPIRSFKGSDLRRSDFRASDRCVGDPNSCIVTFMPYALLHRPQFMNILMPFVANFCVFLMSITIIYCLFSVHILRLMTEVSCCRSHRGMASRKWKEP